MKQNQKLQESLVVEICVCLVELVGFGKSGAGRNYRALLHIAGFEAPISPWSYM